MSNQKIAICDAIVNAGEVANLALPLPERYSCSPLYMPIKVINGEKKGPCLVILSGLKGTELNGLEIANRITKTTDPSIISGTIIAIPVVNVYGLTYYPSTLPTGRDLSNCFPGNEQGSYGERMAHIITEEILKKADYCIELQTGGENHNILPQVYCNFDNLEARKLARHFNAPVVTNVMVKNNPLRQTTEGLNIPLLMYQAGESRRFDESAIELGVEGIRNSMRALNMLPKEPLKKANVTFSKEVDWIIAHKAGILHPNVSLGQTIEEGDIIGAISDPFGSDIIEHIIAPQRGIVVGVNSSPLIYEGLSIFKIASFYNCEKAEEIIEKWDKQQPDSYIG